MRIVDKIKKLKDQEGLSFREISWRLGLNRRTVTKWYKSKEYPKYVSKKRASPVKDEVIHYLKIWIDEDIKLIKQGKRKRIRNASTMWADLHELGIKVSSASVRNYVKALKPKEVFIPLSYEPAMDMQVDWGSIDVNFKNGKVIKVNLFVASLPYSNARFVYPYLKTDKVCFFDGHLKAFKFFGGIPKRITYDNLSSAVKKVLTGSNREETDRMLYFKNYYSFETNYAAVAKGNEKGSVENSVGFVKRRLLSKNQDFDDFDELREYLWNSSKKLLKNHHYKNSAKTIGDLLNEEQAQLREVPANALDVSDKKIINSTSTSLISYDGVKYSIPCSYCSTKLQLKATAEEIILSNNNREICRHKRQHKLLEKEITDFRHYLKALLEKSRALDQATCIKNAKFPPIFFDFWKSLKSHNRNGNREMVRILLLEKYYSLKEIFFAIEWCSLHHTFSYDAVKLTLKDMNKKKIKIEKINKSYPTVTDIIVDNSKYDRLLGGNYYDK